MVCVSIISATVAAAVCLDSSIAVLVARCSSSSVREIVNLAASVTPCVPSCICPSVRVTAVVAFRLASLICRAISSLLSIIVWVKTKPLASIDFTVWSVMRLTSPANCSPLLARSPREAVRFLVEQTRHVVDALRQRAVDLVGPADDIARNLGAHADQLALGLVGAAPDRFGRGGGAWPTDRWWWRRSCRSHRWRPQRSC